MPPPNNKASLGCGTLILIALIVMIFSNGTRDVDKQLKQQLTTLHSEMGDLQTEVSSLKADIRTQAEALAKISKTLEEINTRAAQARPRVFLPARPPGAPDPQPEAPLPEN